MDESILWLYPASLSSRTVMSRGREGGGCREDLYHRRGVTEFGLCAAGVQ